MKTLQSLFAAAAGLQQLPEESQRRLERLAEQRQYRRRHIVHFAEDAGDHVYFLCEGRVKIARVSDQGREVTLYIICPGQIFGEESFSGTDTAYGLTAETLEDSVVAVFRRADFLEAFLQTHEATMALLQIISDRRAQAETKIADMVFLDVPKRLAKLLLGIYDARSERADNFLPHKYTHQELANLIGSTRETTTLILNDLRRQGVIDFLGRKIIVRRPDVLEALLHQPIAGGRLAGGVANRV